MKKTTFLLALVLSATLIRSAPAQASDVNEALAHIRWAWNNTGPCTDFVLCSTYIDHVELRWRDGSFEVAVGIQRLTTSAHDCIVNAKNALRAGERALAVGWVAATQIHNPPVKDWMFSHPDAVVEALHQI